MTEKGVGRPQLVVDTKSYVPSWHKLSPLENAFDEEIQRRFQTCLHKPRINKGGHLTRLSYPRSRDTKLVAFQYTRLNSAFF